MRIFLKDMRSVARFDWFGRLFQSLAPLYEILFWPFEVLFIRILRSVAVVLRFYKELVEFATKLFMAINVFCGSLRPFFIAELLLFLIKFAG